MISDHQTTTAAFMNSRFGPRRVVERAGTADSMPLSSDARRLARAAVDLDTDLITRIVRASVHDIGVILTWERLVQPVWQYLGSRADDRTEGSAAEHLYVRFAVGALSTDRRPNRPVPASVLLACADEELHVFPLEALVAALEESGTTCCVLGARVPAPALAAATARLNPAVVVIWSQTSDTATPAQIATVLDTDPTVAIIAAGPGWNSIALPVRAVRSADLSTTLVLTLAAIEGR
jgi:methanogenic corrinoid protein MtbC1